MKDVWGTVLAGSSPPFLEGEGASMLIVNARDPVAPFFDFHFFSPFFYCALSHPSRAGERHSY